ncbi:hypothetical protein GF377_08645, partial [candidate division GN15 bacterium]|nr:hypothetical protein [candidate division GN15 bacterium]
MKIHVVQKDVGNLNLVPFIEKAQAAGADLACFPELAWTGVLYQPRVVDSLELVLDKLKPYDIPVMVGLPFITELGAFNSYLFIQKGDYKLYHKRNLFPEFGEPSLYQPGDSPGVWETSLGKFGVAICYDIRFGQVFEDLARQSVQRIFIPACFPRVRVDQWREMIINRASEMHVPIVGINAVGSDGT